MKLKAGVDAAGIRPELVLGLMVCNDVYRKFNTELWVTSITDGQHSIASLHYAGQAADLRIRNVPADAVKTLVREIKGSLNSRDYDVVLESDHIHLEWQPKRGR